MSIEYANGRGIDTRAALYARYRADGPGFHDWVCDRLDLPAGGRILDVGCGPGSLWRTYGARHGLGDLGPVVLLDLSPGMLADARDRLVDLAPGLVRSDAGRIPSPAATFDAIVANHMLYDVDDLDATLAELRRVLAPAGALHASTNGARHLAEFREALRRAGLRGESVELPWHMRFDIDGGAAALEGHFDDVRVHRWREVLPVDDVEPLIAYAHSIEHLRERFDADRLRAFRVIVEREIAERGVFPVTCESGLLVARNLDH